MSEELSGLPPLRLADMIRDVDQEIREASHAGALTRVVAAARQRNALEARAALDFGAACGWHLSWSSFGLATLACGRPSGCSDEDGGYFDLEGRNLCEHPYWYRRGGNPAAIAVHLANWPDCRGACEFLATEFGLGLLIPDFPS